MDLTYEELKQEYEREQNKPSEGLDLTYEELKLESWCIRVYKRKSGLDLTYEELKHKIHLCLR